MAENTRVNNFNIIRFVAAMMVVLGHMSHLIGVEVNLFLGQAVSTVGVKIFFLISGYLIANSFYNDSNVIRYAIRRIFRILPGLIGVVLFAVFIVGPICTNLSIREYFSSSVTWNYMKNIVLYIQYFLPGVFETNPYPAAVNGSLWTLPVEVLMYIAVPVIFLIFRKIEKWKLAIVLAILTQSLNIGIRLLKLDAYYVIYGTDVVSALTIIPYFFVGIVFTNEKIKRYLSLQVATGLICVAAMLNFSEIKSELLLFILLPYFIFSFSFVQNPVFKNCFSKNDFSYGMYLYGFLIQQVVVERLIGYQLTLNVYFVICAILSVLFGAFSWFVIEKPAQKLAKRILKSLTIKNMKKVNIV